MDKLICTDATEAKTVSELPQDAVKISDGSKLTMVYGIFPAWNQYSHFYVHGPSMRVWGVKAFDPQPTSPVYRLL